jgi:pimeloyl-ACP methyl ester carboxylesterase
VGKIYGGRVKFIKRSVMGVDIQEKSCVSEGKNIFGKLFIPNTKAKTYPTVILSHGFNSIGDDMADIALTFAENGFLAYTFDYCGGSTRSHSDGKTTEMSIISEQNDLKAVIDMMSELDISDSRQIYLYGESQGGFVAALTAAEMPERIAAMILLYPAFCIPDQWLSKDPESMAEPFTFMGDMLLSKKYYDDVPRYDVYDRVSWYNKPVMIYHGDSDEVVDISYSERSINAFPNAKLKVIKGAGHGFSGDDREYVKRVAVDFFTTL